ncbi:hypothetical protein WN51_05990 [Melipona quadrifasciata]|uniref:Uncharacterized protein n=1 Tax=Melipona quadrifasciata TaxID=166423 RepID=A0A0N1ITY0_9HYME|nr:hypothetical protein WN51_05990 [Melipona quadrifasciata]
MRKPLLRKPLHILDLVAYSSMRNELSVIVTVPSYYSVMRTMPSRHDPPDESVQRGLASNAKPPHQGQIFFEKIKFEYLSSVHLGVRKLSLNICQILYSAIVAATVFRTGNRFAEKCERINEILIDIEFRWQNKKLVECSSTNSEFSEKKKKKNCTTCTPSNKSNDVEFHTGEHLSLRSVFLELPTNSVGNFLGNSHKFYGTGSDFRSCDRGNTPRDAASSTAPMYSEYRENVKSGIFYGKDRNFSIVLPDTNRPQSVAEAARQGGGQPAAQSNEEVTLGTSVLFRAHVLVHSHKIEEVLSRTHFNLGVELWFSEPTQPGNMACVSSRVSMYSCIMDLGLLILVCETDRLWKN